MGNHSLTPPMDDDTADLTTAKSVLLQTLHGVHGQGNDLLTTMILPSIAEHPPASVWQGTSLDDRKVYYDAWDILLDIWLRSTEKDFQSACKDSRAFVPFLTSFFARNYAHDGDSPASHSTGQTRRRAFLLVHRISKLLEHIPEALCDCYFLGPFSRAFLRSKTLHDLLETLWSRARTSIQASLRAASGELQEGLQKSPAASLTKLRTLTPLLRTLPQTGALLAEGSDLLDALSLAYSNGTEGSQRVILAAAYFILIALTKERSLNLSALADHLYGLKALADSDKTRPSLLAELVANTPLLHIIRSSETVRESGRLQTVATTIEPYGKSARVRSRRSAARGATQGKGKARAANGVGIDLHIHLMSKITQVQDLFPDLGSGFVAKLLDAYEADVETVTLHLLEDSLAPELRSLDRGLELSSDHAAPADALQHAVEHLEPRSTPPLSPQRRNIYDNDEFDRLEMDASRFHVGRRDAGKMADDVLADRTIAPGKAAILSALAAFDSDDDERDDTYDEADVGGTVDKAAPDGEPNENVTVSSDATEALLFRAYRTDPHLFARGNDVRRAPARATLKRDAGMTDDAIEGWAIMLARDPRRLRRLEAMDAAFDGQQAEVQRTAYRQVRDDTDEEGGEGSDGLGRGGFRGGRGRGRGRGGGRGGGRVAGETGDAGTQVARQRKEAGKGSRANHNRRDQRAKKMARGGFGGGS